MAFDVYSRNGEILPASEAVVPLSNVEYAYGFGVYETIRAVRGKAGCASWYPMRAIGPFSDLRRPSRGGSGRPRLFLRAAAGVRR